MLIENGYYGNAPVLTKKYDTFRSSKYTFSSTWSERHIAYAAGLGQFGLNKGLITSKGINVRLGSIITNLNIKSIRRKKSYQAPCYNLQKNTCGKCIELCPVGAISKKGLDKEKCYNQKKSIEKKFMTKYIHDLKMFPHPLVKNGKRYEGYSLGCALCQIGSPCENKYIH